MPKTEDMGNLENKARRWLEASQEYLEEYNRAGLRGAVVWVEASDGGLVIFTRGEHREYLKSIIAELDGGLATQESVKF